MVKEYPARQVFVVGVPVLGVKLCVDEPVVAAEHAAHVAGVVLFGAIKVVQLSVQVDGGATLDLTAFTVSTQKIDAITIDLAAGGGTVLGGSIVAGGALMLTNALAASQNAVLPLLFQNTSNADNFRSWSVIIDGHATSRRIRFWDGRLSLVGGLALIVR